VTQDRPAVIRSRLEAAFAPQELDVADESHLHIGHAGARDGRGHFRVRIVSSRFAGTSPIERHRMIYEALDDMMKTDIHALSLTALAPSTPSPT
jgi:BolA family transcriptional regulator, general stress-responsive regulator